MERINQSYMLKNSKIISAINEKSFPNTSSHLLNICKMNTHIIRHHKSIETNIP